MESYFSKDKIPRPSFDISVEMNHSNVIELSPQDDEKTIGTSGLGGCLAIVALVEDKENMRRCGVAHFDPMSLKIDEVYGQSEIGAMSQIKHMFNQ